MAKTNEVATKVSADTIAKIEGGDMKDLQAAAGLLSSFKANDENEITADYFKIEPGEVARVIFIEMTEMSKVGTTTGEKVAAVRLMTEEGAYAINGDAVIVSTCSRLKTATPLEITCTGKNGIKGKNEYRTFKIVKLTGE